MRPSKSTSSKLLPNLKKLRNAVEMYSDTQRRSALIEELDRVILGLSEIRKKLSQVPAPETPSHTVSAIDEVLRFLDRAKADESFLALSSEVLGTTPQRAPKPEIPPNLTNQQIRDLLQNDLSKSELEQIARQRGISSGKRSKPELRSAIQHFVERQESYDRLRA